MRLYFTARKNIGSKLIRWATDGDVSHVAIGFGGAVFHSTEHGFMHQDFKSFSEKFEIKKTLEHDIPDESALLAFTGMMPKRASYDYSAFAFFAWCVFKYRFLDIPLPNKNLWNTRGYLCTEMAGVASDVSELMGYGKILDDKIDLAITSPIELFYLLLENKNIRVVKCS